MKAKWEEGRGLANGLDINDQEALDARKEAVGDMFYSRFPPEPNGHLRIIFLP